MIIRQTKGLTFDDVLLIPKRSPFASRKDVTTVTQFTPTIQLNIPIVSANMDTVTEAGMAIAMARSGGLGILHRFMTIEQQVRHVRRVKRAEGFIVENPYSVEDSATVAHAKRLMGQYEVGGLVVTNGGNKMVGLVTQRREGRTRFCLPQYDRLNELLDFLKEECCVNECATKKVAC